MLRTPEGAALPPNTLAEMRRDMSRLRLVENRSVRLKRVGERRLDQASESEPHAMIRLLARVVGIGIETADMLVHEILLASYAIGGPLRATPV